MSNEEIRGLARAAGLAETWTDALGIPQQVSIDSLRRILDALGLSTATSGDIEESWQKLGPANTLPPIVTMKAGSRLTLPARAGGAARGQITYEDGSVATLRFSMRGEKLLGPTLNRVGYHRLEFGERHVTVAVAPPRCLTIEDRAQGKHLWGVAAQIYSLRRPGDGGIGDATAVRHLVEGAARHGADAVALSPVHSLFAADPGRYGPYSPSSRLFFNPLFADPEIVFGPERVAQHRRDGEGLEHVALIDWRPAAQAKLALMRRLLDDFEARDLARGTELSKAFDGFVREGGELLQGHALFEALHGKWSGSEPALGFWRDWPTAFRHGLTRPDDPEMGAFRAAEASTIRFHLFLQWLAARSFEAAQEAAVGVGMKIGLISDLAIGMDRAGSHAWSRQSDLLLGLNIGAPPDEFNRAGQDWGLSSFSPRALVATGFDPFLSTLRAAMRYAGGVRIDHIMGLRRLWLVPEGASPADGAYLDYPLDDFLRLLALESHRHGAVVIGEDLGTVPRGFRRRLAEAGIAGMDVMWFERNRGSFRTPGRWRRHAVSMTTTHDLPTVAGWWRGSDIEVRGALGLSAPGEAKERQSDRRRLWQAFTAAGTAQGPPPAPDDPAPAVDAALGFVASSPAPLMIAPLEDLLGLTDQPNLPGTIDQHPNWRRRLDPPAAKLFDDPAVARRAATIVARRP
ncbi:MAG: 4-alpha-glucanotransferase [Reyranella sp.]|uniref:4-alpha-glucanotransferase n=1 Tax=Reyranella sp. TaxID=1929291 RepID=UPI0011FA2C8F|nr:4-alpha-glucanotransferase [Reyranella sp.]TAJ87251.1 MAG: 4-alpha-glucanotransferase [Reyranella sp.]